MLYVVSYDLRKKGKDYRGLSDELQRSSGWWHYLESTWLIVSWDGADQIYNRLRKHLDVNDTILIMQVGTDYQGWLPKEAHTWIQNHLSM